MHGPTIPLVPIMPTSGAKRCMLPPRPYEQPVSRPISSAARRPRRDALGQRVAVASMRAEDHVVGAEVRRPDGDRLLADIRVAGPVHQPPLMGPRQVLLAPADRLHLPVQGEQAARPSTPPAKSRSPSVGHLNGSGAGRDALELTPIGPRSGFPLYGPGPAVPEIRASGADSQSSGAHQRRLHEPGMRPRAHRARSTTII